MDNCCMSSEELEAHRIHQDIERHLRASRKESEQEIKLLLLGMFIFSDVLMSIC